MWGSALSTDEFTAGHGGPSLSVLLDERHDNQEDNRDGEREH
jgi:hypothetical protein